MIISFCSEFIYDNEYVIPAKAGIKIFKAFSKMDTRQNNSGKTKSVYSEQKLVSS
jgi:hypothetical protein